MTEVAKQLDVPTGDDDSKEKMSIDELDRMIVIHKIQRLEGIQTALQSRVAAAEVATPEEKAEKETELKKVQETDSKGDDIIQKALDDRIERLKQELTVFEDKDNIENMKNILEVMTLKVQHLKFFGC